MEHFQNSLGNTDGALEAFRVRIEAVSRTKHSEIDKKQMINALRLRIRQQLNTKKPSIWLDKLRLDLAQKLKNQNTEDANIQSLATLQPCLSSTALPELTALCKAAAASQRDRAISVPSQRTDQFG